MQICLFNYIQAVDLYQEIVIFKKAKFPLFGKFLVKGMSFNNP